MAALCGDHPVRASPGHPSCFGKGPSQEGNLFAQWGLLVRSGMGYFTLTEAITSWATGFQVSARTKGQEKVKVRSCATSFSFLGGCTV